MTITGAPLVYFINCFKKICKIVRKIENNFLNRYILLDEGMCAKSNIVMKVGFITDIVKIKTLN